MKCVCPTGRVAARNMLGKEEEFQSIPYFWTVQYGKSLRYCGHALSWDEIVYDGSTKERKFAAYYVKLVLSNVCDLWWNIAHVVMNSSLFCRTTHNHTGYIEDQCNSGYIEDQCDS